MYDYVSEFVGELGQRYFRQRIAANAGRMREAPIQNCAGILHFILLCVSLGTMLCVLGRLDEIKW